MLKSHQPKPIGNIYPVNTEVFQAFVSANGFNGTHVVSNYTMWIKDSIILRIPRTTVLSKDEVLSLLEDAELGHEDFEEFVPQYLQDLKNANIKFDMFIEQSLHTSPKKKST